MKVARLYDPYRGNGFFLSFRLERGFLTLAFRWRWHFYRFADEHKRRWYFGPFEVELPACPSRSGDGS